MSLMHLIGRSKSRNAAQKRAVRPRLESLEKREVLAVTPVVNSLRDTLVTLPGEVTLRSAVALSNSNAGPNTITFASNLAGQTINLDPTLGEIDISNNSVKIDGAGQIAISAQDQSRIFGVSGAGLAVEIDGLSMIHGGNVVNGGAIRDQDSTVTLNNDLFDLNRATNGGGAVVVGPAATLNVNAGNTFLNNSSGNVGGAIANYGTTRILSSTFVGNTAGSWGGALFNMGASATPVPIPGFVGLTVTNSVFTSNSTSSASGAGGAVMSFAGSDTTGAFGNAIMVGDTFLSNHSADGGAYAQLGGTTNIFAGVTPTVMYGNFADINGGAIFERADAPLTRLSIAGSNIFFNQAGLDGGGVFVMFGTVFAPTANIYFNTPNNKTQV